MFGVSKKLALPVAGMVTDASSSRSFDYPPARRGDVVDDYHGVSVADPYRWLEDPDAPETQAFVAAQTAFARAFLDTLPTQAHQRQRLAALWDYTRVIYPPEKRGGWVFFWQQDGLRDQPVLYRQPAAGGPAEMVLDPNRLSDDGTVAVTVWAFNQDGSRLAYALTEGGSDWQVLRIRDLTTGQDYPETLPFCRFPTVAWSPAGDGFFYNRHEDPADRPAAEQNKYNQLYWHPLGAPHTADRLVYARPDAPELNFPPRLTHDHAYLVLEVWHGAINRNRIYYRPLTQAGDFIRLIDEPDAEYDFLGNVGRVFYFRTDWQAPKGQVIAIDLDRPEPSSWRQVVAEQAETLALARLVQGQFILVYVQDAAHQVRRADLTGRPLGELPLPGLGTVGGLQGEVDEADLFLLFFNPTTPPLPLHADLSQPAPALTPWRTSDLPFPFADYVTRRLFAPGRDGTPVPLFVTHHRDLVLDGSHPTILYGYGGFSISLTPQFEIGRLVWLEQGGVFAQASLRGGAEYGEDWHQAGMLDRKQTVFDDFIACAEYLIQQGYTATPRLALRGRSNGGLLTAACMTQRPDLMGAVICQVPVIDMLRYHRFTAGRYWVPEYGNPDDPAHFPFLYAYSPLHAVRPGVTYPPTLILTADRDDRVVPMHAHKFAASLQHADAGRHPILLRFDVRAGHGFGKPAHKVIDEEADVYAFLHWALLQTPLQAPGA